MDDLIKRQDVMELMDWYDHNYGEIESYLDIIREDIKSLPSTQKTGKWIHRISPDEYHCGILECPFCGWEEVDTEHLICCARCGTRMVDE